MKKIAETNCNKKATNSREKNLSFIDFAIQKVIQDCSCNTSKNKKSSIKFNIRGTKQPINKLQWIFYLNTKQHNIYDEHKIPITTIMLDVTTPATDKPTKAQTY